MKIKMITAHDSSYNIGFENQLPWHLPEDLQHFKNYTLHKPIIMGSNTFKSIGKALPKRRNIVLSKRLSHDSDINTDDIEIFNDIEGIYTMLTEEPEIIVIGGSSIYEQFLHKVDELVVTEVIGDYEGDAKFPNYKDLFILDLERTELNLISKNGIKYNIKYYNKKQN